MFPEWIKQITANDAPRCPTQVNHPVQRRCSCSFHDTDMFWRHLGMWLQEGGEKHSRDTGNREEEEQKDGRRGDADEAIYSDTEGGRVSRARWFDECVWTSRGWGWGSSGENQEQQCKVSVVVGEENRTLQWLAQRGWGGCGATIWSLASGVTVGRAKVSRHDTGVLLRSTVLVSVVCVGRRRPSRNRNK